MQLLIIYDKTIVINDITDNLTILELKKIIYGKINIPIKHQILNYSGNLLINNNHISDYNIINNSILFLTTNLDGGNVKGFPNVGNLIILLMISSIMILIIYYFFYLMMFEIIKKVGKNCTSEKNIMTDFIQNINSTELSNINFKSIQKGGINNIIPYYLQYIFTLSLIIYASIVVIILTIYFNTLFCNEKLSNWLIIISLSSLLIIFIVFMILYNLTKKNKLSTINSIKIAIFVFLFFIVSIFISMLTIPKLTNTPNFSWLTYIYPIGVAITGIIIFFINKRNISAIVRTLIILFSIVIFIFIPYILAFVYNNYNLCGEYK